MQVLAVVGTQWGDEGKGKIVDLLAPSYEVIARYGGGHNAGHTVRFDDQQFALHIIPSGILQPHALCILGNGMVISPDALAEELLALEKKGITVDGRLFISERAHLILPIHILLDKTRENASDGFPIGTTCRGIGPAYETKVARLGLRVQDLLDMEDSHPRLEVLLKEIKAYLSAYNQKLELTEDIIKTWIQKSKTLLRPYVTDTAVLINSFLDMGKKVLLEGAQGTHLDIDFGTYPYVTSSHAVAAGASLGLGIPPQKIDQVLGVIKAYTTRVGRGPFPAEQKNPIGEHLRKKGNEFGTTTGRPRRTGWLDLVMVKYAIMLSGIDSLALTKIDVLDGLDEISVCVGYRYKGTLIQQFPASLKVLEQCAPQYEHLPGWETSTQGITRLEDLPKNARNFIDFLEDHLQVPIQIISTGPRRKETIHRK